MYIYRERENTIRKAIQRLLDWAQGLRHNGRLKYGPASCLDLPKSFFKGPSRHLKCPVIGPLEIWQNLAI